MSESPRTPVVILPPQDRLPQDRSWDEPWPPPLEVRQPPEPRRRWKLPLVLYLLTFGTTFLAAGPVYSLAVMTILTFHELGHFFQSLRYRVPASFPYFIPLPLPPLGTMGAVIAMPARISHAKALFDIAITGPLAGLVPTVVFTAVGLQLSSVEPLESAGIGLQLGSPLLFDWIAQVIWGAVPEGHTLVLHPLAFAGWVGFLITALNLVPIGQLDGGHILYSLLGRRAHAVAKILLLGAIVAVVAGGYWTWVLMLLLLIWMGPKHPPTGDDSMPLGRVRVVLGWLTLAFVIVGFTPTPIVAVPELPPASP